MYQVVVLSKAELKPLKKTFCDPCRGLRISAHMAGLMVSALIELKKVEMAMVRENWRKSSPVIPPRNAGGTNTAMRTNVVPMTAPLTSSMDRMADSLGLMPCSAM